MHERVVVLGAGYAGAGAVQSLESALDHDHADIHWLSRTDYHLVLHEAHRAIRDPTVRDSITIPVDRIKSDRTTFQQGEVVGLDSDARTVALADGSSVDYDYLVVGIGSATATYGIPGLAAHAHTLKSLPDAVGIHEAVVEGAGSASHSDPAKVVVGGAGLSGIQAAGEVAELRDTENLPIEVTLVEALSEIFPAGSQAIRETLEDELAAADITVRTDDPITEVEPERIAFDEREPIEYDVMVWTGGITGHDAMSEAGVDADHGRLEADATFQTSDERIFAIGDGALVAQNGDVAPPTAQAAWDAAELVGENVCRAMTGLELQEWEYDGKGTLISVGETAFAADIPGVPVEVFDSIPAKILKKGAAARWIASITSWPRALRAWNDL
ncbi:MAG: NAD(P)/FAD-dependent oxidoreductase [Halobacteriaceae archaeon]